MKRTAILFPGQGSQYLGMGREFIEADPEAAALMAMAENISGSPLRRLCFEGPIDELTRAVHLQPALTVINLICYQQLIRTLPDFTPAYVGGHSLGECSALYAGGILSAEDTMALVSKRGEFIEREGAANPGGMQAILGLTIDEVEQLLESYDGPGTVVAANHNSEKQVIVSGDNEGLEGLNRLCRDLGARVIPLQVSVANHSPLIAGAVDDFASFMETLTFDEPKIPILFNVTAAPEKDPAAIRSIMARQIVSRVRWYESINIMIDDGVEVFVELGPKNVLTGLMKKIVPRRSSIVRLQADTPESLEKVVAAIKG